MNRQSVKASGRSSKTSSKASQKSAGGTVKKVTKSARGAGKTSAKSSAKSARSPVGKLSTVKTGAAKAPAAKSAASKASVKAAAAKASTLKTPSLKETRPRAAALIAQSAAQLAIKSPAIKPDIVIPQAAPIVHTPSPPMQAPELPIKAHRYTVGETVYYTSPNFGRTAATGSYTVIKLLPSESDDYQYRIKSNVEAFERVAKESQLDKA